MDLMHPNLLQQSELIQIIQDRQLNIENLHNLNREELITIFKKYIMPKPKRQSKNEQKMELDEASSTTSLTNEVKRIKLTRETPPPVNKSTKKRPNDESNGIENKRQRIKWP